MKDIWTCAGIGTRTGTDGWQEQGREAVVVTEKNAETGSVAGTGRSR